jgi:hypothetical protein
VYGHGMQKITRKEKTEIKKPKNKIKREYPDIVTGLKRKEK